MHFHITIAFHSIEIRGTLSMNHEIILARKTAFHQWLTPAIGSRSTGVPSHHLTSRREVLAHYVDEEEASFFRCSMNTCSDTSSVNTGAPPSDAYGLLCVNDGLTFESRNRA